MAIGERIRFFRNKRCMTQKNLGMQVGFPEDSADIRLAQYEAGTRTPKANLTAALADSLDVSPQALAVPEIDSDVGLMHTLFSLEDRYGLEVCENEGEVLLRVNTSKNDGAARLNAALCEWYHTAALLKDGKITQEEYDKWRHHYPECRGRE